VSGGRVRDRAVIVQQKTKQPVQFELMDTARKTMRAWLERRRGTLNDYVFPSRNDYMAPYEHATICPLGTRVSGRHRASAPRVRNALTSAHEGLDHLQGDWQSQSRSDPSRSRQDREHGALPWRRCGRRSGVAERTEV
jgi:hypothetical protein